MLSLHLADFIMTLRMSGESMVPRDALPERTLEFLRHSRSYPHYRYKFIMTLLAVRAEAVLQNIAKVKPLQSKNLEHKFTLDIRYNLISGSYRRLGEVRYESDKMGFCQKQIKHSHYFRCHSESCCGLRFLRVLHNSFY